MRFAAVLVAIAAVLGTSAAQGALPTLESPTITVGPPSWTQALTADFEFDGHNEGVADLSFQCRVDGGAWASCDASPAQVSVPVGEGPHTFEVEAITGPMDNPAEQSTADEWQWTVDVTPPSIPHDETAEAASAQGAVVPLTASDNLDPSPALDLNCSPASGSLFPLGTSSVTCTVTDEAGNHSTGSLSVTVKDTTAPVIQPHADVSAGQTSASGAVVQYDPPVVRDAVDASPSVHCSPQSGSAFQFGTTTVTCTASDSAGNDSAPDKFDVIVQKGPLPPKPTLSSNVGSPTNQTSIHLTFSTEPGLTLECRLEGPAQSGNFGPCSSGTAQNYSGLEDGSYLFTLRVTNSIGNVNDATRAWRVDTTPPALVGAFRTRSGRGWVKLRWTKPVDSDYKQVVIRRKRAGTSDWTRIGIRRDVSSMVDWKAKNDVLYTYSIRSVDRAENASPASSGWGRASTILKPQFDAALEAPVEIDWATVRDAAYFNMQVWRDGRKILSVWPLRSQFRLQSSWTFKGRRFQLTPDRYRVYVWPGYGPKLKANYGPLFGWTAFSVR